MCASDRTEEVVQLLRHEGHSLQTARERKSPPPRENTASFKSFAVTDFIGHTACVKLDLA